MRMCALSLCEIWAALGGTVELFSGSGGFAFEVQLSITGRRLGW